jgi:hypothetical protein
LESYGINPAAGEGNIVVLEVIAIILLGGAAVGGVAFLLQEYRSRRDFDWN